MKIVRIIYLLRIRKNMTLSLLNFFRTAFSIALISQGDINQKQEKCNFYSVISPTVTRIMLLKVYRQIPPNFNLNNQLVSLQYNTENKIINVIVPPYSHF